MSTFGFFNQDLDITVKIRVLPVDMCENFVSKHEDLPKTEYMLKVLDATVANIDSEVRPVISGLEVTDAAVVLDCLYNYSVMLNPVFDVKWWAWMAHHNWIRDDNECDCDVKVLGPVRNDDDEEEVHDKELMSVSNKNKQKEAKERKPWTISKAKLNSLPKVLKCEVIGQDYPIDVIYNSLRRHQVGLGEENRPIGVYLMAGASGVGKTHLARKLNEQLFGEDVEMMRVDCGEFQHKHENQKLLGSPSGYIGYDDGGFLAKMMKGKTSGVFLLDEVEKAHRDFWDTFLRIFEEGKIRDSKGNLLDFRNFVFILTSNLGNEKISETEYGNRTGFSTKAIGDNYTSQEAPRRELVVRTTMEAIRKFFKPELLNRLDEIIVFNHLSKEDFRKIADLEFQKVSNKLLSKNLNVQWTDAASDLLVQESSRAMEGARSMARVRRNKLEDPIAEVLFKKTKTSKGRTINIDAVDSQFVIGFTEDEEHI